MGRKWLLVHVPTLRFPKRRRVQLLTDDTEKTKGFYRSLGLLTLPELGCCGFMRP